MNIDLSDEAAAYGRVARQALDAAGGDRLVQLAEQEPDRREGLVVPVLAELGAWDLDPRASGDELEAAAALCRSAGWWAVPYPVAERLCRPVALDVDGMVVVADAFPSGPLDGLGGRWAAMTLVGRRSLATPLPSGSAPRTTAFVTPLELHPLAGASTTSDHDHEVAAEATPRDPRSPTAHPGEGAGPVTVDVALGLVLPCWTLLGMLDRAIDLTRRYVREREQFGQPLSSFQGVQFQLTDAEVERAGVEELAKYALWSIQARRDEAADDALALRVAAIEAAETVFRVAHQLHGAIGFCDEATLSWLSRHSQPLRRLPLGLSATRDRLVRRIGRRGLSGLFDAVGTGWVGGRGMTAPSVQRSSAADLDDFRIGVREWCRDHVPRGWRQAQTGASDEAFVAFQKGWFQELRGAGFAVPHWPEEWGGGMSTAEQVMLHQELAAHDAPRLVLAFVGIHHATSTLLAAGTDEQRQRHLPTILDGEIWCQGFSEPDAGSDLASLKTSARRVGDGYVVNGQKVWASWATESDWCLLLARTDPEAPKRKGISYLLMDMRSPGIDVRPIRQANGDAHFCEMFLDDVTVPAANLVGSENAGWQVAQATLSAERGMTMLELAERLANGFRWLVEACARPTPTGGERPLDDPVVQDRLAAFDTELTGLRALCRSLVERVDAGRAGPADASIAKLFYSELLQRMTDFGTEIAGLATHAELHKPRSSGWESGVWLLDFIGSWEWTIPGGTSEIQRTIIAERGLGLPREPTAPSR